MIDHPDIEELELAARGQRNAHVETCPECAQEVQWLRRELQLVSQRRQPEVGHLWSAIERRIQPQPRKTHWHRPVLATAAAAAAAMVVVFLQKPQPQSLSQQPQQVAQQAEPKPRHEKHHLDEKSLAALNTAEADYRHAAQVLETEYASLRKDLDPKLAAHWDETLTRARAQLTDEQQSVAQDDVRARMRVLDGYAEYLRSLKDVIQNSEEASP
jgi:hypothetical protein